MLSDSGFGFALMPPELHDLQPFPFSRVGLCLLTAATSGFAAASSCHAPGAVWVEDDITSGSHLHIIEFAVVRHIGLEIGFFNLEIIGVKSIAIHPVYSSLRYTVICKHNTHTNGPQ